MQSRASESNAPAFPAPPHVERVISARTTLRGRRDGFCRFSRSREAGHPSPREAGRARPAAAFGGFLPTPPCPAALAGGRAAAKWGCSAASSSFRSFCSPPGFKSLLPRSCWRERRPARLPGRPEARWGRDEPVWPPELGGGSAAARPAPAGRSPAPGPRGDAPGRPSPLGPHRMPVTCAARGAARGPDPPAWPPSRPTYPMNQSMAARGPPRPPPDTLGPQPATAAAAAAAGSKHSLAHSHTRAAGAAGSDAPRVACWEM